MSTSSIFRRLTAISNALNLLKSKNSQQYFAHNRGLSFATKPLADCNGIATSCKRPTPSTASIISGALLLYSYKNRQENEDQRILLKNLKIDRNTGLIEGVPFYEAPSPNSGERL